MLTLLRYTRHPDLCCWCCSYYCYVFFSAADYPSNAHMWGFIFVPPTPEEMVDPFLVDFILNDKRRLDLLVSRACFHMFKFSCVFNCFSIHFVFMLLCPSVSFAPLYYLLRSLSPTLPGVICSMFDCVFMPSFSIRLHPPLRFTVVSFSTPAVLLL